MYQMIAQIFLGCMIVINGILILKRRTRFTDNVQSVIHKEHIGTYCRNLGITSIYLGIVILFMSQLEFWTEINIAPFFLIYLMLVVPGFIWILYINKKFSDKFFFLI